MKNTSLCWTAAWVELKLQTIASLWPIRINRPYSQCQTASKPDAENSRVKKARKTRVAEVAEPDIAEWAFTIVVAAKRNDFLLFFVIYQGLNCNHRSWKLSYSLDVWIYCLLGEDKKNRYTTPPIAICESKWTINTSTSSLLSRFTMLSRLQWCLRNNNCFGL